MPQWTLFENDFRTIDQVLAELLERTNALSAHLIDRSGQLITSAGRVDDFDAMSFASLVAADFTANAELANKLENCMGMLEELEDCDWGDCGMPFTIDWDSLRSALARHAAGEPAKHPDTERLDWLEIDPQARLAEIRRLIFTDRDTVREAIEAARKEVQP